MCIAAVGTAGGQDMVALANKFAQDVANPSSSQSVRLLGLRTLGEIGKIIDLSSGGFMATVDEALSSDVDGVKAAASYALGNISAGNLPVFLPKLLTDIREKPARQNALLTALKELVKCQASTQQGIDKLRPFVENIWTLLYEFSESPEEGTRNVVAECLGKLTLVNPEGLLPELEKRIPSPSEFVRSTTITVYK